MADRAPDVTFLKTDGSEVKLTSLLGQKIVVLFFYPKDHTAGCTAEACSFRDSYEDFKKAGAEVIGISSDDAASHESFKEKFRLPFTLLTDRGGAASDAFGIKKSFLGLVKGRVTFVIDRQGVIRHRFESQIQVKKHVSDALEIVRQLDAERPVAA